MPEQPPKFESEDHDAVPKETTDPGESSLFEPDPSLVVIPIDENIFRAAEAAAARVTDKEKRKLLDVGIDMGKYRSFEYAEWVLECINDGPASPKEKSRWEELEKDKSHNLAQGFGILRPTLSYAGIRLPKFKDGGKEAHAYKEAALAYAFRSARDFLNLKKEHPEWDDTHVAGELHIPSDAPMSEFIKRGQELPSGVPERKFFELP